MSGSKFFTYIIQTINNKFYCGYTDNLDKRFEKHLNGTASKFTRANKPDKYVYIQEYVTKNQAMKEEYRIKKLARLQKEKLIQEHNQ